MFTDNEKYGQKLFGKNDMTMTKVLAVYSTVISFEQVNWVWIDISALTMLNDPGQTKVLALHPTTDDGEYINNFY